MMLPHLWALGTSGRTNQPSLGKDLLFLSGSANPKGNQATALVCKPVNAELSLYAPHFIRLAVQATILCPKSL